MAGAPVLIADKVMSHTDFHTDNFEVPARLEAAIHALNIAHTNGRYSDVVLVNEAAHLSQVVRASSRVDGPMFFWARGWRIVRQTLGFQVGTRVYFEPHHEANTFHVR